MRNFWNKIFIFPGPERTLAFGGLIQTYLFLIRSLEGHICAALFPVGRGGLYKIPPLLTGGGKGEGDADAFVRFR